MIPETKLPPSVQIPSKQLPPTEQPKVQEADTAQTPIIEMHDAPYSWTITVVDANGFSEMFTVRAVSEKGFFERVTRAKVRLLEQNYKPAPTRGASAGAAQTAAAPDAEETPICAIHKTPMQKRQGRNGSFWSCPQKLEDNSFCPYRPKQNPR